MDWKAVRAYNSVRRGVRDTTRAFERGVQASVEEHASHRGGRRPWSSSSPRSLLRMPRCTERSHARVVSTVPGRVVPCYNTPAYDGIHIPAARHLPRAQPPRQDKSIRLLEVHRVPNGQLWGGCLRKRHSHVQMRRPSPQANQADSFRGDTRSYHTSCGSGGILSASSASDARTIPTVRQRRKKVHLRLSVQRARNRERTSPKTGTKLRKQQSKQRIVARITRTNGHV